MQEIWQEFSSRKRSEEATARTHTADSTFKCTQSGIYFDHAGNLKQRERLHTGEMPYECNHCGKCFRWAGNLKRHARSHTGEKPFKCKQCGRSFSDTGNLRRHVALHARGKTFKCNQCGQCFNQPGNLALHKKTHNAVKPDRSEKDDSCFSITELLSDINEVKQEWRLGITRPSVYILQSTCTVKGKYCVRNWSFISLLSQSYSFLTEPFYTVKWLATVSTVVVLFGTGSQLYSLDY